MQQKTGQNLKSLYIIYIVYKDRIELNRLVPLSQIPNLAISVSLNYVQYTYCVYWFPCGDVMWTEADSNETQSTEEKIKDHSQHESHSAVPFPRLSLSFQSGRTSLE